VGNRLDGSITFRTRDQTPPKITIRSPTSSDVLNGAAPFDVRYDIQDATGVQKDSITIRVSYAKTNNWTTVVTGWDDPTGFSWLPSEPIEAPVNYLLVEARDGDGNSANATSQAFRIDTVQPRVVSVEPPDGSSEIPLTGPIKFEFSEPMKNDTRPSASLGGVSGVSLSVFWEPKRTLVLAPAPDFPPGQRVTISLSDALDQAGNPMASPYRYQGNTTALPITARVKGVVVSSEGALLNDVDVIARLQPAGTLEGTAKTGAQGGFLMNDLPPGNYTISFQRSGYSPRTVERMLPAGVLTDLQDVILFPSDATIAGSLPIYVLALAVIGLLVLFIVISRRMRTNAEGEELKAYLRTESTDRPGGGESEPDEDEVPAPAAKPKDLEREVEPPDDGDRRADRGGPG
jgi:hypothetical protein